MATTLTATFDTRHDAEMTVERLVQEKGIDRADIDVTSDEGDDAVTMVVDLTDDGAADGVKDAFVEFNSAGVVEN